MTQHRIITLLIAAVVAFLPLAAGNHAAAERAENTTLDSLRRGFADPPGQARPLVWWHWMNGNITADGLRKDMLWMHRSGIAGFHVFDANFSTPQIVDKRIEYMSEEWKQIFGDMLQTADSLGMEVSIASSPGFSATGGPWVKPEDAMKKIVWRELLLEGGTHFKGPLPEPYTVTGQFQDLDRKSKFSHYEDIAVVAIKVPDNERQLKPIVTSSGGSFTSDQLMNGSYSDYSELPADPSGFAWIQYEFPEPVTVKAMTSAVDYLGRGGHAPERVAADTLMVSDDGVNFRAAAPVYNGFCYCQTFDMEPVTGRFFRWKHANPRAVYHYSQMKTSPAPKASKIAKFRLHTIVKINHAEEKGGYASAYDIDSYPTPEAPPGDVSCEVLDLTPFYNGGTLSWDVPEGRWRVYRFGASLTGKMNHPASPEATGLEVDKLSPGAWKRYFHSYLEYFRQAAGDMMGSRGIRYLLADSYEADLQNWTPELLREFKARRGYDATLWLPVLDGAVIRSAGDSERFLWDWRRTIGELFEENYARMTEIARGDYGLEGCYIEAHANGRVFNADGMSMKRTASYPMSEMWVPGKVSSRDRVPEGQSDIRESASVAHIYGQNKVAAESLTSIGLERQAWTYHPGNIKRTADLEFGAGVNRFVIHDSAHQPLDDKFPGLGLGVYGQWFNRHECWAEQAYAWVDYLARSSYILQQGRFVADVLWFYGENTNITAIYSHSQPDVPAGYNFDYVNPEALLNEVSAEGGSLKTASGMNYRLLCIDPHITRMTVPVLEKIVTLAEAGAIVCGTLPLDSPSLSDSGESFRLLLERAEACPNFLKGASCREALGRCGIQPDVEWNGAKDVYFVHRSLPGAEIYWVNNSTYSARELPVSFRCEGMVPEIWHPEDGRTESVGWSSDGQRSTLTLSMESDDAFFVVFRPAQKGEKARGHKARRTSAKQLLSFTGPWKVEFQKNRGAPESIDLPALTDLSVSSSEGVRHFSGTAVYKTSIKIPSGCGKLQLDLGKVFNIAEVYLNGRFCGIVWKEPFRVDISDAAVRGVNSLEVRVTNLWPNRLIGDAAKPAAERLTYSPIEFYKTGDPLLPSGLVGPVTLIRIRND